MKLFQKKHGAVTVFLVIILVPVMLVSSIFVDVCRLELAQSVVNSAGDLALNTLLSQYDSDLNEFYGMMASCQSIDEFYDTAGEFYETALRSKGLEDNYGEVAGQIKDILMGDQEVVDLLQISWQGDKAYNFSEVPNGNLANPALVKREIVEFMKYRSPINGAADLLEKLKKSKKGLEDSEKDADLIEKKEDYYEAEKDVLEAAKNAYKELKKYQDMAIDKQYVDGLKSYVENLETEYKKIDEKVIRDLYNTSGLNVFQKKSVNFNPDVPYSQRFSSSRKASADQMCRLFDVYRKAEDNFNKVRRSLDNALNLIPAYNSVYDIQYWKYCYDILRQNSGYMNYGTAVNKLCEAYAALKNAAENMGDGVGSTEAIIPDWGEVSSIGKKTIQAHWNAFNRQYSNYKRQYLHYGERYFQVEDTLHRISTNNMGNINGDATDRKIKEISGRLTEYKNKIEEAGRYLDQAADKVSNLKKYRAAYQTAKNNWSASANSSDTELANMDREEISKLSQEQEIMNNITEAKIEELVTRIHNIRELFNKIIPALDSCKYNGYSVRNIKSLGTFKSVGGIDVGRITYVESNLRAYVSEHSRKVTGGTANFSINNSNNPAMQHVNPPSLYVWLMKYFKDFDKKESEYEDGKKEYEEYKENQDGKDDDADTKGNSRNNNEISSAGNLPSASYAKSLDGTETHSSIADIADFTRSFCNDFAGTLASLGVKVRDDIYSVDYIMSMFSYDTYENEGKYELCNDSSINLLNYSAKYNSVANEWKSDKVTDTYNKSLTNHMINADNNWSYQNEVEYILYGGSNVQNKAAAYSRIFLLRYALNLPAEFMTYWSDPLVNSVANAISLATYGIVPAALVKLAIILALTILETGTDLLYLQAGIPVLLIKGKGDLFIDFSKDGIKKNITNAAKTSSDKSKKEGLKFQYSDYIKLFLFIKLFNEQKSYGVYARTADVIQVNMAKKIAKDDSYGLKKSIVYFNLKSDVRVQPMMLDLPLMRAEEANQVDVIKELDWCKIKYEAVRGY